MLVFEDRCLFVILYPYICPLKVMGALFNLVVVSFLICVYYKMLIKVFIKLLSTRISTVFNFTDRIISYENDIDDLILFSCSSTTASILVKMT